MLLYRIYTPATTFVRNFQVTVLGAANELGQTVSLLLRSQPSISKLVIHDSLQETPGVLLDVSHIPSQSVLLGFAGDDNLDRAVRNSDIVIATGGVLLKPGATKKGCFSSNTAFIKKTMARVAKSGPMPFVGIVTEPINSTVPMAAEVMRNNGDYDAKKLFGITTIDQLRCQCLYALQNQLNPCDCIIPVIGGHSNKTTIPLLSQAKPFFKMNDQNVQDFTATIRKGGDIVTKAKRGCSPTLSVAYSVLLFVRGILDALEGHPSKVHAYVENNDFGTAFFGGLVNVTKNGIGEMQRYQNLSAYECHLLERSIGQLRKDISKGKKVLELA